MKPKSETFKKRFYLIAKLVALALGVFVVIGLLSIWIKPGTATQVNKKGLEKKTTTLVIETLSDNPSTYVALLEQKFSSASPDEETTAKWKDKAVTFAKDIITDKEKRSEFKEKLESYGSLDKDGKFTLSEESRKKIHEMVRSVVESAISETAATNSGEDSPLRIETQKQFEQVNNSFLEKAKLATTIAAALVILFFLLGFIPRWRRPSQIAIMLIGLTSLVMLALLLIGASTSALLWTVAAPTILIVVILLPGDVGIGETVSGIVEFIADALCALLEGIASLFGGF